MFSFSKIIGLLAAATLFTFASGVDALAGAQGLARREFGDTNGIFHGGIVLAGRQANPTTVTSTVTVSGSDCGASILTTTMMMPTTVATLTVLTTVNTGASTPIVGTVESTTTSVPSMSSSVKSVPSASSESSTVAPPATAAPTTGTSTNTPATIVPGTSATPASASASLSSVLSASASGASFPTAPTGSTVTTPSPSHTAGHTNSAELTKFNVLGGLAAVGIAAFAVY